MTKTNALSRRKLLGRIGLLAAAGYTVPALTTLSMAQAGSGASGGGTGGGGSSAPSAPSNSNSGPSAGTGTGGQTVDLQAAAKEAACGVEDLNSSVYMQCLVSAGF